MLHARPKRQSKNTHVAHKGHIKGTEHNKHRRHTARKAHTKHISGTSKAHTWHIKGTYKAHKRHIKGPETMPEALGQSGHRGPETAQRGLEILMPRRLKFLVG